MSLWYRNLFKTFIVCCCSQTKVKKLRISHVIRDYVIIKDMTNNPNVQNTIAKINKTNKGDKYKIN